MNDKNDEREDEFAGQINLGNPGEFTILEFGKTVINKTKQILKLHNATPTRWSNIKKPDPSLTKENLNCKPKIMLNEELDKTIAYDKQNI